MSDKCILCERGREACQFCEGASKRDWESMCDCGLVAFGNHLFNCRTRDNYKYVIAGDHVAAEELK